MRRLKTGRRPPIYPKTPGHLPCSSLTHPLPLSSRRPSVSFGGFGLSTNNLSGEIPAELGSLSNLEYLNLSFNGLSGEIPAELGSLSNLKELLLDANGLSGEIPAELGSLSNLQLLVLHRNELSGEIQVDPIIRTAVRLK